MFDDGKIKALPVIETADIYQPWPKADSTSSAQVVDEER
jgi:hypothetical protein